MFESCYEDDVNSFLSLFSLISLQSFRLTTIIVVALLHAIFTHMLFLPKPWIFESYASFTHAGIASTNCQVFIGLLGEYR